MKILKRIIRAVINLIVEIGVLRFYLIPWITTETEKYNVVQYLMKIYEEEDVISVVLKDFPQIINGSMAREQFSMMPSNAMCYAFFIVVACMAFAAFMNILNLLFSLFGMPKRGIVAIAWWFSLCAMVVWYMIFNIVTLDMYVYPIIFLAVESLCFFMTSMADGLVEEKKRKKRRGDSSSIHI